MTEHNRTPNRSLSPRRSPTSSGCRSQRSTTGAHEGSARGPIGSASTFVIGCPKLRRGSRLEPMGARRHERQEPHCGAARLKKASGRDAHNENSTAASLILLEIPERLSAILDELDRLDTDVDVPRTIAEGCLEGIDRLLTAGRPS